MYIKDLFDPAVAESDIENGYLRLNRHPDHPGLVLLNYAEKAQFDNHWTPATLRSRGLIYDQFDDMRVVALPFPKFFNHDQFAADNQFGELPFEPFDVFDKFDGSLGIFFHYADSWHVATRGSFTSDQAKWAQQWLDAKIEDGSGCFLDHNVTYLAEIIYPANRVVVDYRGLSDCTLLGGYDRCDGRELPLKELREVWPGNAARVLHGWASLNGLVHDAANADIKGTQREGFVIRFKPSGLRVKVKYADYKRIHGLFTETNEKTIWALLANGQNLSDLAEAIPDELYVWCREVADGLDHQHDDLVTAVHNAYESTMSALREHNVPYSRKDFALMAKKAVEPRLMKAVFLVLDSNFEKLSSWAWRQLEPKFGGRRPGDTKPTD